MIELTAKINILPYDDSNIRLQSSDITPYTCSSSLYMIVGKKPNINEISANPEERYKKKKLQELSLSLKSE